MKPISATLGIFAITFKGSGEIGETTAVVISTDNNAARKLAGNLSRIKSCRMIGRPFEDEGCKLVAFEEP